MSQTVGGGACYASPASADLGAVTAGLQTRERTAAQLGVSVRTVHRWELAENLPVISVGKLRLHDPAAVRAWLLGRQTKRPEPARGPGRPRKRAA